MAAVAVPAAFAVAACGAGHSPSTAHAAGRSTSTTLTVGVATTPATAAEASTTVQPATAAPSTAAPAAAGTTTPTAPAATSATSGTTASTGKPSPLVGTGTLPGKVIVLDPGHNGGNFSHTSYINQPVFIGNGYKACDTTGTATDAGYTEAAYNFDVATRLAALLRAAGATVILTRPDNSGFGPCVTQRAAIANQAHADAAISIHADGGPPGGRGFHVIQPAPVVAGGVNNTAIVAPSDRLALDVRRDYQAATGMPFSTYTGSSGLETRSDLGGLNLSTVPKVFIETGNMRNSTDAALLESPDFRQKVASGLAQAFIDFLAGR